MKRLIALLSLIVVCSHAPMLRAQQPDTLRLLNVSTNPGQEFWISVYLRNIEVIGAYGIRMSYDTALIEPVTFVHGTSTDIVHELVRGTAMELHGGAIFGDGLATFLAVELVNAPPFLSPGAGTVVRMRWRARPGSGGQVTPIRFESDTLGSFNNLSNLDGTKLIFPVLADGQVTIGTCQCPHQGDINGDGLHTAADLAFVIDLVFFGGSDIQDPSCPTSRPDYNWDGFADAVDLSYCIQYIFFGGPGPVDPCGE